MKNLNTKIKELFNWSLKNIDIFLKNIYIVKELNIKSKCLVPSFNSLISIIKPRQ